ncbi:hypothetical protein FJT64_021951 [Amphibalanus amphitrite]|uniref:Uncharacterized protein n=1 Tax=Amphibalanus amphitrite TaxID=1232801 RepID=A0A6A4WW29_AMPAM|nr:hypothetical protein FJT64_021951 [Amphibalanus amphitrite]
MEAAWHLLAYPVHDHAPTVEQLPVHLGGEDQPLRFAAGDRLDEVVQRGADTKLTSFFKLCAEDDFAATLFYHQVPRYFTWQQPTRSWRRRRRGAPPPEAVGIFVAQAIGRVFSVSPRAGESFFLRVLLHQVPGPRSYADLRTVDGRLCATFQEACSALGLLEDSQHWHRAMAEAAVLTFPRQLRRLFAAALWMAQETADGHR